MSLTRIVLTITGGTLLLGGLAAKDALAQEDFTPPPKKPGNEAPENPGSESGQPGEQPGQPGQPGNEEGQPEGEKKPVWTTVKTQWGETFDNEDLKTEEAKALMEKLKNLWLNNEAFKKDTAGKQFNITLALQRNADGAYSALFRFVGGDGSEVIAPQRITEEKQVEVLRNVLFPGTLEQMIDPALKPYMVEQDGRTLVKFPLGYDEELSVRELGLIGFYRAAFPELYKGKTAPEAVAVDRDLATRDKEMLKKEVIYDAKEKAFYVVTHLEKGKTRRDQISEKGVLNLVDAIARQSQLQTTYMSKEGIVVNGETHNAEADKKALEAELESIKKQNIDPKKDISQTLSMAQLRGLVPGIQDQDVRQYAERLMNMIYGDVLDPSLPQAAVAKRIGIQNLDISIGVYDGQKKANMYRIQLIDRRTKKTVMTYHRYIAGCEALGGMNGLEVWEAIKNARSKK
ncbi:hypothetical protein KY336_03575 [Candidatus Woesearchaeota archaeon]|nr:hypothetical protein [Candidatus Woesearchaeota archaeon]